MKNNEVVLIGNLTKDPEYRPIGTDGKELMGIRVAVNHKVKEGTEETLFMDVTAFGYHVTYAKNVSLAKGDRVFIRGRLQERSWVDQNGMKQFKIGVVPETMYKCVLENRV
jgi:single-strand DNA-binding protein